MRREHGFTLIDLSVATAILCGFLIVTAFSLSRPPKLHLAALALQAALVEGRSLAMTFGQISDVAGGVGFAGLDGATVTITPDPADPARSSLISVWRSRPRASGDPLAADPGFPPERVPVRFISSTAGAEPFSILISSAGYTSVQPRFPATLPPPNSLQTDPGCRDGESITVVDAVRSETHRLECNEGVYDASVSGA